MVKKVNNNFFSHTKQTNTHTYSHYSASPQHSFGFLTIPKSGSTNFKTHFKLHTQIDLDKREHDTIYASLRNPYERFLSGILESLKRVYSTDNPIHGRDIPVSPRVYKRILTFELDEPINFLNKFLESLIEFGFFDPHIEPQFYFLFKESGKIITDVDLFPLTDMSNQIKNIAYKDNKELRGDKSYHTRRGAPKFFFGKRYKLELDNLTEIDKNVKNTIVIEREHPFNRGLNLNFYKKYLVLNKEYLEYKISKYYNTKIINVDHGNIIKSKINELYKQDLFLYEKLLTEYSGKTVNLLKIIS